ncbi:MAG TPA: hypothetical protein VLE45_15695, partial [Burkholderiaceae bacterium]|nr:hypothetical protein [Burkholderiaceae bacterium]
MASDERVLPHSADGVLKLAARSMFDLFAQTAMGMMVVDRSHRIVWISEGYKRFLPALGFDSEGDFVGKLVEAVVPNTLMNQVIETGRPILVDLLTNKAGTFLVSRLPLRDDEGRVIGAVGLVLMDHPESTMQPLMTKFVRLQRELEFVLQAHELGHQRLHRAFRVVHQHHAQRADHLAARIAQRQAADEEGARLVGQQVDEDGLAALDHLRHQRVRHHLLDTPADEVVLGVAERRQEALVALADPDDAVGTVDHHHAH